VITAYHVIWHRFSEQKLKGFFLTLMTNFEQIKYLRVPDTLLDQVKEEQSRAREANRTRGGHAGSNRSASSSKLSLNMLHH